MQAHEAQALLAAERDRLLRARIGLLAIVGPASGTQREATGELSGMDEHLADSASETFEREFDFGLLRTIDAEVAEVDAAIERVASARFGRCRMCGRTIPDERLRAVPATTLCLHHQDEAERADAALRDRVLHGVSELDAVANLDLVPVEERPPWPEPAEEAAVHLLG